MSQNLVLMLLGGLMLGISAFSTQYVNYVKEGFRPFLIAAGVIIVLIGLIGLVQDLRGARPEHGHHHSGHRHGGPRVAWLLCLPAPATDSWIEVTGTPIKVKPDQIPQITAVSVRPVTQPEFPYE